MGKLTKAQKIILIVFIIIDIAVVAGLAGIIINNMRNTAQQTPVLVLTATKPAVIQPTWTPTTTPTPASTLPPRPTNTPVNTSTPFPTYTPSPTATPSPPKPVPLNGAEFDFLLPNRIPGWQWYAFVNYRSGDEYDPETSFADEAARRLKVARAPAASTSR